MSLRLHYAIRSDVGHVREGNEDSAYAGPYLLAVADGMGGHAAGEVASSTVIGALADLDSAVDPDAPLDQLLLDAMHEANAQLRSMAARDGSLDGMGTTVTALLSAGDQLGVLHVGDSRCYLLRDEVLSQITHDHTLVQDLVDQGRITPEQANTHPQRSLLMRALDGREVDPDLDIRTVRLHDRYLLCSDGLSGVVSGETILEALLGTTPQEAVDRLVELALKGGGPDNITVVVADVVDDEEPLENALVAGAAAEKSTVPGATPARVGPSPHGPDTDSPAARAARNRRSVRGSAVPDDLDDDLEPARRGGGRRVVFVGATVVVLLVVIAAAGWAWMRDQYYVGVQGDRVAIFKGVPQLGSLAHLEETFGPIDEIAPEDKDRVRSGVAADSLEDARTRVTGLHTLAPTTVPTVSPSPTIAVTPGLGAPLVATTAPAVACTPTLTTQCR